MLSLPPGRELLMLDFARCAQPPPAPPLREVGGKSPRAQAQPTGPRCQQTLHSPLRFHRLFLASAHFGEVKSSAQSESARTANRGQAARLTTGRSGMWPNTCLGKLHKDRHSRGAHTAVPLPKDPQGLCLYLPWAPGPVVSEVSVPVGRGPGAALPHHRATAPGQSPRALSAERARWGLWSGLGCGQHHPPLALPALTEAAADTTETQGVLLHTPRRLRTEGPCCGVSVRGCRHGEVMAAPWNSHTAQSSPQDSGCACT